MTNPLAPQALTVSGQIALTQGSTTVVGTGTAFTSELQANDVLTVGGVSITVGTITDDTNLEATVAASATVASAAFTAERPAPPTFRSSYRAANESFNATLDKIGTAKQELTGIDSQLDAAEAEVLRLQKAKTTKETEIDGLEAEALKAANVVISVAQQYITDHTPSSQ